MGKNFYIAYSFIEEEVSANQIQTKNTFCQLKKIDPGITGIFLGNRRNLFWGIRKEKDRYFVDKTNFKTGIIEKYLKIGILRKNFFPYLFARRCGKILKNFREPKRIYIRQGEVDEFIFYLKRLDKLNIKKIIFEFHNLNFKIISFYHWNFEKKYSYKKHVEFFNLLKNNPERTKLVSLTQNLANIIAAEFGYKENIEIIPDAHSLLNAKPKDVDFDKEKIEIIYTGLNLLNRGVDVAIYALEFLPDNFYFRLVGGKEWERENLIKKYPSFIKQKRLILEPPVPYCEVEKKLIGADIAVLPTLLEGMRDSSSPLKMFDYMAVGMPIIASNAKIFKEILTPENALFFEENNSKDLADKIIYLSKNEELAKKIGQKAFEDSKKYSYEKRAEKIYSFFNNE